jgi:hypothetical protein
LYVQFAECKSYNFLEEIEKDSIQTVPSSLITPYKLERNPVIAAEKQKEKCTQIAVRLEPLIVLISGVKIKEFPLQSLQFLEILKFKKLASFKR